jgi:putative oxidoreductase
MSIGLLVLRFTVGLLFMGHGSQKLFGRFGGAGLAGTAGFFDQLGMRPGRLHARAAGAAEFFGGLLLVFGLFTPFAAAALIAVMTAAILTVHGKNGPWNTEKGYEYNLVLIAAAFALAAIGAGSISLDAAFNFDFAGLAWGIFALAAGMAGGFGAVAQGRSYTERRDRHPAGARPTPS